MDKTKFTLYFRRTLFLLVLSLILLVTGAVLARKTTTGAWNYSLKVAGFGNEPAHSFDLIGIGSSHMYCTLNPLYLYEQTGLRSYVLATQEQPPIASYYYAKEAFKTQSPDVLIIEALMFAGNREVIPEGVAHDAIDPFPDTMNKLMLIHEMNQQDGKENYYINFLKYHSRWKELTRSDFDFSYLNETDPYHGYVFLTRAGESTFSPISYDQAQTVPLKQEHLDILLDLRELAEENGATLVLLFAPCPVEEDLGNAFASLHAFARENGILTLDLNLATEGLLLDPETDFYDSQHLNVSGSEKASLAIGNALMDANLTAPRVLDDEALWQEDLKIYHAAKTPDE